MIEVDDETGRDEKHFIQGDEANQEESEAPMGQYGLEVADLLNGDVG